MSTEGDLAVTGSTHCGAKADGLLGTLKFEVRAMVSIALHTDSFVKACRLLHDMHGLTVKVWQVHGSVHSCHDVQLDIG